MRSVRKAVRVLESHRGSMIRPGRPADDALLELLVHMASRDGVFDDAEIAMLEAVLPDWNETRVRQFIGRVAGTPLDLGALAGALNTDDDRWTALRFAARMAHKDEVVDDAERAFLDELAEALSLPDGAVEDILDEVTRRPVDALDADWLGRVVDELQWEAADFAAGSVQSRDLVPQVPEGATPVRRIGVDQAEVIGIYTEGVVARFLEGPAFLRWGDIVAFTRGAGLESSVRLHTEDGQVHSLVDGRLGGLLLLFERLYRPTGPRARAEEPVVVKLAGRDARPITASTWDDSRDESDL